MPTDDLRPRLAREGMFNVRDLGGLRAADGRVVAPGRLVRGAQSAPQPAHEPQLA